MKTKNLHVVRGTILLMSLLLTLSLHSQISYQGLITEGDGAAGWNADGSGPEPQGSGHSGYVYYVASRDYVDPDCDYGSHVTGIGNDFSAFSQALADHGFIPGQLEFRMGLASLGDDQEGSDWFVFGSENYMNFYPIELMIYLDNEPMISGSANYIIFYQKHYNESKTLLPSGINFSQQSD
ncbi:MAG TPA: hypothetical protein PKI34_10985 [Bacteroidales bacterium]|nr:hypothetical protein [Bacteroidales bacterium]